LADAKSVIIPTSFESRGRGFVATFTKKISFLNSIYKIAKIHENLSQTTTAIA